MRRRESRPQRATFPAERMTPPGLGLRTAIVRRGRSLCVGRGGGGVRHLFRRALATFGCVKARRRPRPCKRTTLRTSGRNWIFRIGRRAPSIGCPRHENRALAPGFNLGPLLRDQIPSRKGWQESCYRSRLLLPPPPGVQRFPSLRTANERVLESLPAKSGIEGSIR